MNRILFLNGPDPDLLGTREPFRRHSYLSPAARRGMAGPGVAGYVPAIACLVRISAPRT